MDQANPNSASTFLRRPRVARREGEGSSSRRRLATATHWCAENHVAIVALDWTHDLLSFVHGAPRAEAALVRAQCSADPVLIARELINKKIAHSRDVGCLTTAEAKAHVSLRSAATVAEIDRIEARAAALYWNRRQIELQPRRGIHGQGLAIAPRSSAAKGRASFRQRRVEPGLLHRGRPPRRAFGGARSLPRDRVRRQALSAFRGMVCDRAAALLDRRARIAFLQKNKFSRRDFIRLSNLGCRCRPLRCSKHADMRFDRRDPEPRLSRRIPGRAAVHRYRAAPAFTEAPAGSRNRASRTTGTTRRRS